MAGNGDAFYRTGTQPDVVSGSVPVQITVETFEPTLEFSPVHGYFPAIASRFGFLVFRMAFAMSRL